MKIHSQLLSNSVVRIMESQTATHTLHASQRKPRKIITSLAQVIFLINTNKLPLQQHLERPTIYKRTYASINKCSAVTEMSDCLATIDISRKDGALLCPFRRGGNELGSHLTQCGLGWGLPPYQMASWSIQPFGHNTHKLKSGGAVPHFRGSWIPI